MRLSAAERKELERQRKLFESELARRERAKQRKSDEPDYKKMFREEEKKLNESLMSDDESFVNEADVEFRRRQLMLLKVEKELKPMARGYGVSPSGTKAKLVEKILEHEMKTLAMIGTERILTTQGRIPRTMSTWMPFDATLGSF